MSDEPDRHPLNLRTHTSLWQVEKRLYKLYDFTLPSPVSLKQLGFFLGFSIPWGIILGALGVPFAAPWHLLWLAPPVMVTIASSRPVAEGKRLGELAFSQIKYLTQPREMFRMSPAKPVDVIHVSGRVWRAPGEPEIRPAPDDSRFTSPRQDLLR